MACAGHTLPPSGCGTLPGPTARPTEEQALIWAAVASLTQLLIQLSLWVWQLETLGTCQTPHPMCGTMVLLLALWLRDLEIGAD